MFPTTNANLHDKEYDTAAESTVKIEDVDYGALEQLNLHGEKTFQNQKGSFEHVAFQGSTFNFDKKYNMQGRFAFNVDELPIQPKYGDRLSHRGNYIFKTSFCPGKSPTEDSVTTG